MSGTSNSSLSSKTLFFFTDAFPLGWAEHYIEKEIDFLCEAFKNVVIFPLNTHDGEPRQLPSNAQWVNIHKRVDFGKSHMLKTLARDFSIVSAASKFDKPGFISLYKTLFNARAYSRALEDYMREQNLDRDDVVCYSYWFYQWSLIVSILRANNSVQKAVSRAHFADVYQYVKETPFTSFKLQHLDKTLVISEHGISYLKAHNPDLSDKLEVAYLGVKQHRQVISKPSKEKVIVTCSTIRPKKRVDLIAQCIARLDQPIRWVHFGTGPKKNRDELMTIIDRFPDQIAFEFKGWAKNEEVMAFYLSNQVDMFVNLSTHEGVPVSIMEATSFGVPVVATDVFGTSEALSPKGCKLIPVDAQIDSIVETMKGVLADSPDRDEIMEFSDARFDAEKNYTDFIQRHLSQ